jgi:hypothetical protein
MPSVAKDMALGVGLIIEQYIIWSSVGSDSEY